MSDLDVRSEIDGPSTRLKMAKILQDYKNNTVDYIRTAQALEALIDRVRIDTIAECIGVMGENDPSRAFSDTDKAQAIRRFCRDNQLSETTKAQLETIIDACEYQAITTAKEKMGEL